MSFEKMFGSVVPSSPVNDLLPVSLSGGLSKYYQPLFVPSETEWNEFEFETEEDQLFNFNLSFSFEVESNEFEESTESNSSSDLIRVGKATNALEKAFCDSISAEVYSKSLGDEARESYRNHWKDGLTRYSGGSLWIWDETDLDEQIDSIESEIAKVNEEKKKFLNKSSGSLNSPLSSSQNSPVQSQESFFPTTPVVSHHQSAHNVIEPKIVTVSPKSKTNKVTSKSNTTFDHSPETVKKTITISTPSTMHHQRTRVEHVEEPSDDFILDIIDTDQLALITPVHHQQRPLLSRSTSGLFPTSPMSCHNSGTESPSSGQEESSFCLDESSHFFTSSMKTTLPSNLAHKRPIQMAKSQSSTLPIGKKRMAKEEPSYIPSSKPSLISSASNNNKRARTKQVSEIFKLEQIHRVQAISPDDENEEIDIL